MYGNFAGRDASRGMAKQSFELGERRWYAVTFLFPDPFGITIDMLTPIDQPLDKLADLRSDELYVSLLLLG